MSRSSGRPIHCLAVVRAWSTNVLKVRTGAIQEWGGAEFCLVNSAVVSHACKILKLEGAKPAE